MLELCIILCLVLNALVLENALFETGSCSSLPLCRYHRALSIVVLFHLFHM